MTPEHPELPEHPEPPDLPRGVVRVTVRTPDGEPVGYCHVSPRALTRAEIRNIAMYTTPAGSLTLSLQMGTYILTAHGRNAVGAYLRGESAEIVVEPWHTVATDIVVREA